MDKEWDLSLTQGGRNLLSLTDQGQTDAIQYFQQCLAGLQLLITITYWPNTFLSINNGEKIKIFFQIRALQILSCFLIINTFPNDNEEEYRSLELSSVLCFVTFALGKLNWTILLVSFLKIT